MELEKILIIPFCVMFARGIIQIADKEPMERHGEEPEVIPCQTKAGEMNYIKREIPLD